MGLPSEAHVRNTVDIATIVNDMELFGVESTLKQYVTELSAFQVYVVQDLPYRKFMDRGNKHLFQMRRMFADFVLPPGQFVWATNKTVVALFFRKADFIKAIELLALAKKRAVGESLMKSH